MGNLCQWKPFDNENLPPKEQSILVLMEGASSLYSVATWSGEGRTFLVSTFEGRRVFLPGVVTHWLAIPELPK